MAEFRYNNEQWNLSNGQYFYTSVVRKFGANNAVGTTPVPVTQAGVYHTPTAAVALEVVSSSAGDTLAGVGARTFQVQGLGADWLPLTQTVNMNGTTAVALPLPMLRVYRWAVQTSGTYATQSAGSQVGTITLRQAGGGATWGICGLVGGIGRGQSQVGVFTTAANQRALVQNIVVSVDATKAANILLFQRENANTVAAPFAPMRIKREFEGVIDTTALTGLVLDNIPPYTDFGFMAFTSAGTAQVSVDFDIILNPA